MAIREEALENALNSLSLKYVTERSTGEIAPALGAQPTNQ
jgi:hypothetical protein